MTQEPTPIFDGPIPGESLTHELGSQPDEAPPEYADPSQAYEYMAESLTTKDALTRLGIAGELGIPLDITIRAVVFAGWAEGKYTIDTMYLIYPLLLELSMELLDQMGVPYVEEAEREEDQTLKDAMEALHAQREFFGSDMDSVKETPKEDPEEEEEEVKDETPSGGLMGRPVD